MAIPVDAKDPQELLDYRVDWSGPLGGDTIVTSSWAVSEGTVTIGTPPSTKDTTSATAWVGGGLAGEIAILTNTITTAGGRTYEQSIKIRVVQK